MANYKKPGTKEDVLTDKQKLFCEKYVVTFNGKQSAIDAGYAAKGAEVAASRMLTIPKVKSYINQLLVERRKSNEEITFRVMQGFADIAFHVDDEDKKITERDRLKALELLGKTTGMFVENMNITANTTITGSVAVTTEADRLAEFAAIEKSASERIGH